MRTQLMIMVIVLAVVFAGIGVLALLIWGLGWLAGLAVFVGAVVVLELLYVWVIRPWHGRWGATDDEVSRAMPGDELIPGANQTTRAVTVAASAEEVWPWLVQLGFGKAGWYSYDWIDNDFQRSADRILPEYQQLEVGDQILMTPQIGFTVTAIDRPRSIVSRGEDGSTSWCLALYPGGDGHTRLVSRWRARFHITPATALFIALSDPGTFIMEQKMLRTIRQRVEAGSDAQR